jgi:hypothetical protein
VPTLRITLIAIRPALRSSSAERLLMQNDGPMLQALKRLNGGTIHRPKRDKDRPDRDGSTKPVTMVVTNAGIAVVEQYKLRMP